MQILYLDVLFLLNTIMNLFIFKIATTISNERSRIGKLIIAAIISSLIYCVGLLVPMLRQIPMGIYQCFVPIISVVYIFKCQTIKMFLKKMILVNGVAWAIGGISFNLYYMLGTNTHNNDISIIVPISAGFVMLLIIEIGYSFIRSSVIEPKFTYDLVLHLGNKKKEVTGYLDTGNTLYTMNHQPVMLVEYEQIINIIPDEYKQVLEVCKEGVTVEKLIEFQKDIKIYLIPFTSVGCKEAILIGIPIGCISLSKGNYKENVKNGVIGICYHHLFRDRRYQALIHPDLIR